MKFIHIVKSFLFITICLQSIDITAQEKGPIRAEDINKLCCKSGHNCCKIEYININGQKSTEALKLFSGQKTSEQIQVRLYDKSGKEIENNDVVALNKDGSAFVLNFAKLCPPRCPDEIVAVFTSGKLKEEMVFTNLSSWPPIKKPWKKNN
jgi:hypothetical protein